MRKGLSFFTLVILVILLAVQSWAGIFDKAEYKARRAKLMNYIPDGIAILLGAETAQPYTEFIQNNDFIYFTGVEEPNAILILDGMKKECILFLSSDPRLERSEGPMLKPGKEASELTGIERIYSIDRFTSILEAYHLQTDVIYTPFQPQERMTNCGRENISYFMNRYLNPWDGRVSREKNFINLVRERFPSIRFKDISPAIAELRLIKSPAEIEVLRESARISSLAHIELMRAAKPGMYEWELDVLFEYYVKRFGAKGTAYYTIVASGPNNAYAHYHKNTRKMEDGDIVVLDAGSDYHYYDTDITITFPVNGKFTEFQKELYNASFAVERACISVYRPGVDSDQVRKEVDKIMKEKGIDTQGMRGGVGHWVGLAPHDDGPRGVKLKPGMVFAIEPMKIIPEKDFGVRVEDTVLITEDGCENLTYRVPRTIEEIEKLMAEKGIPEILEENGR